jgi:non-ribosomal peptide synthetase component F
MARCGVWHAQGVNISKHVVITLNLSAPDANADFNRCAAGFGLGDVIGLAVKDGIEMIPCLLAILLTGAAFAPIDPEEPLPRQASSLAQCRLKCVIARARDLISLESVFSCPAVDTVSLIVPVESALDLDGAISRTRAQHSHSALSLRRLACSPARFLLPPSRSISPLDRAPRHCARLYTHVTTHRSPDRMQRA